MSTEKKLGIAVALFFAIIAIWQISTGIMLEYYWFESVGHLQVFMKNITTEIYIFIATFMVMNIAMTINWYMIRSYLSANYENTGDDNIKTTRQIYSVAAIIATLFVSWTAKGIWQKWLIFDNQVAWKLVDPIFGNDIGFYVFSLPFYRLAILIALISVAIVFIINALIYGFLDKDILKSDLGKLPKNILIPYAIGIFLIAALIWLDKYSVLYSESGIVYGAGYVDVNIWVPALQVIAVLVAIVGFVLLMAGLLGNKESRGSSNGHIAYPIIAIVVIFASSMFITGIFGFISQEWTVKPSELQVETPYIENEMRMTSNAYGLDNIEETFYQNDGVLSEKDMNSTSIVNARIMDYRPLKDILSQQHMIRTYYDPNDIDIDRYQINGKPTEVLLAVRELNKDKIPSKTWVNERLGYTHGYGITVNPVNVATEEGMPVMFVKDIPPVAVYPELSVPQPGIYYGEMTNDWVMTNTIQKEFDYPFGDENVYTTYNGTGGIELSTSTKKFVIASRLDLFKILFSNYITSDTKLHINRNIKERAEKITPFLYFDRDPYIYTNTEEIKWMLSGMVHTGNYPYAEPGNLGNIKVNYARDSVKVREDAYNGEIKFYRVNDDPMIRTWEKIYPGLFLPIEEMPQDALDHIKYPEDLFLLQVSKLTTYHMRNLNVFYNKEDRWQIAREIYGTEEQDVEPYNSLLELNNTNEFMLMLPLTPATKQNMIAWLAVHQNYPKYGKLILYKFSKDKLTYGPMQVESRISANQEISAAFTLWGQAGSKIIRGNLLVIPVRNALLYIEPVFIVSSSEGAMPELNKVIAVYHDPVKNEENLVWDDTLEKAVLRAITGQGMTATVTDRSRTTTNSSAQTEGGCTERTLEIWDKNNNKVAEMRIPCDSQYKIS